MASNGHTEEREAKRVKLEASSDSEQEEPLPVQDTSQMGDLYLDTVNRMMLDFDFEKVCSVTTSNVNVYSCLVCGKYLQGRGKTTAAYQHSLDQDHHVFMHLDTLKVYILPDLYEVNDPSLDDIRLLLKPTFTPQQLPLLSQGQPAYDLAKKEYLPGFIGLNNISQASFMNAVLQALLHVAPFRDYFIHASQSGQLDQRSELVQRLGMLCRKFWSPKLFKSQVSPHEFLQEASTASGRRYKVTEAADPLDFLSWLLNALHRDLGGTKRARSSIVYSLFQGQLRVQDQAVLIKQEVDPYGYGTVTAKPTFETDRQVKTSFMPFLVLSVDLPPPPVFQDAVVKNIIPQVSIDEVLAKFDGRTAQNIPAKGLRRYKITDLPPVVILHYKRFTANNFVEEKNPTIVTYPLKGLDFRDYVEGSTPLSTEYDLVANITHSSTAGTARENTEWKVHVHTQPHEGQQDERWFQMQDLIVESVAKEMVPLGEAYIQVWERRLVPGQSHKLDIDTKAVVAKPKTTKAKSAKHVETPEELARKQKAQGPGVRMGKVKVEKGDAGGGGFEF